jgi:asparagine synthase (glutamine-hydrolysing)
VRNGQSKWLLRQLLFRYVPRELIERPKVGFSIPFGEWIRGPLQEWADSLLDKKRLEDEGFLRADVVRKCWDEHRNGRLNWRSRLWNVLMFQAWLEKNG